MSSRERHAGDERVWPPLFSSLTTNKKAERQPCFAYMQIAQGVWEVFLLVMAHRRLRQWWRARDSCSCCIEEGSEGLTDDSECLREYDDALARP